MLTELLYVEPPDYLFRIGAQFDERTTAELILDEHILPGSLVRLGEQVWQLVSWGERAVLECDGDILVPCIYNRDSDSCRLLPLDRFVELAAVRKVS